MKINGAEIVVIDTTAASSEKKLAQWMMDHPDDPMVQEGLRSMFLFAVISLAVLLMFAVFLYKLISAENRRPMV